MSVFNHNCITIDSIIEYLYKDGKELTVGYHEVDLRLSK